MEIEEIREQLLELKKKKDVEGIKSLFEVTPSIDIAEAIEELESVRDTLYFFRIGDVEYRAEVFAELSVDKQQELIKSFTDKEILSILEESYADDIVDSLDEYPANMVARILNIAPKDLRKDINTLLNYKENTAGSVMTTEYVSINSDLTTKQAIELIRAKGKSAETIYTIFVRDNKRNMVGTLNLDDLIFAKDDEPIIEIMNKDFVFCHVDDDQEEVANDFKRYDLNAMAVFSKDEKLVGVITIDDIVDVIVNEANEDIANLNKVSNIETPYLETPIRKLLLKCVPWIIVLMILQVFSTLILSTFQNAIAQLAILSVFTPLIMDAGGNSGGQTTTIIVRSLALEEFDQKDVGKVVWKEFRVAACIGGIVAAFSFCWLMFEMAVGIVNVSDTAISTWGDKALISLLVASTLFVTMIMSRLIGCLLPFLAKALKKDPAVMCGPITTTLVDIISLLTYFLLWTYVFCPMLGL
ncbi:MAG: magnesium transporter [Bacilli bacterium]|nr:magnesium transporter [Bacilli bacterium]